MSQPSSAVPPAVTPDPTPDAYAKSTRKAMLIVFLVVVVDLLGFGIVLPILPVTGDDYVNALFPLKREVGLAGGGLAVAGLPASLTRWSGFIIGGLMAVFSLMQFFFAPVWGKVSDRVGRRPVLLIGLVGSIICYSLFGYAAGMPADQAAIALGLLFASRIGAGVFGATISTAQAVIADCTPPDKRKHGMAIIGAAFGIAFTFGPMLGALALWLAPGNRQATGYTGYVSAAFSVVALVLAVALLPETRVPGAPPAGRRRLIDLGAWRMVLASPAIAPVILIFFLATLGFGAFEATLAVLLRDALGLAKRPSYYVFAYVGFTLIIAQGFLYRRLAKKLSEITFITTGIILMAIGVLALAGVSLLAYSGVGDFNTRLAVLLLSLPIAVVGFAFLTPSAQALVSRRTDQERQGEVLGVNQSAASLARILAPIFGLALYKQTNSHMLPYVLGAGLLLMMLPMIPRLRKG